MPPGNEFTFALAVASPESAIENRIARIRAFVGDFPTQKDAAEALGVSPPQLSKALSPSSTSEGRLDSIEAAIARRKLEAIERGEAREESKGGLVVPGASRDFRPDTTVVYHGTIRAGASSSHFIFGEGEELDRERWEMARDFVYEVTMGRLSLRDGDHAMRLKGWSMKRPNGGLDNGQLIFYRPAEDLLSGERYVLDLRFIDTDTHRAVCKRVQVLVDGSIILRSDNRGNGYQDEFLRYKGDHFVHEFLDERIEVRVVGRVIWPDESDEEREIRVISHLIESMASSSPAHA